MNALTHHTFNVLEFVEVCKAEIMAHWVQPVRTVPVTPADLDGLSLAELVEICNTDPAHVLIADQEVDDWGI